MIRARSWGPEHVHPRCNCLCRSDFAAWAGEGRSGVAGTTREPFDEPTTQKRPALRVACGRTPASLRRSTDVTASLFAARLADRLARTQRRRPHMTGSCSGLRVGALLAYLSPA